MLCKSGMAMIRKQRGETREHPDGVPSQHMNTQILKPTGKLTAKGTPRDITGDYCAREADWPGYQPSYPYSLIMTP